MELIFRLFTLIALKTHSGARNGFLMHWYFVTVQALYFSVSSSMDSCNCTREFHHTRLLLQQSSITSRI